MENIFKNSDLDLDINKIRTYGMICALIGLAWLFCSVIGLAMPYSIQNVLFAFIFFIFTILLVKNLSIKSEFVRVSGKVFVFAILLSVLIHTVDFIMDFDFIDRKFSFDDKFHDLIMFNRTFNLIIHDINNLFVILLPISYFIFFTKLSKITHIIGLKFKHIYMF